jgi:peroxiredoxin Q/BCP
MIAVGQKIPSDFTLQIVREGAPATVVFRDLLTQPTIVSVYMKNNTPGCDRQTESLAAHAEELSALGYQVIALSRDTCGSHMKYAAKKGIAYTLASDPTDAFARATDSVVEKSMYGKTYQGPARAAYVLAPDGTVQAVIAKVDTQDHAGQLKAVLAELGR